MKQLYSIIFILGAFFTMTSCSDWLDVSPETEKKQEDMFSTETGYKNVLTGAYIRMKSTSLYGEEMVHGTLSMLAQNWNNTTKGSKAAYLRMYDYKAAEVESTVASIYSNLFKVIADVNGLLKDIDANRAVFKGNNYALIKAEALAIRAFCHFDVLRLFGPMPDNLPSTAILPYVKSVSTTPNSKITYEEFTTNLLNDLQEAEELFEDTDPIRLYSIEKLNSPSSLMEDTYWGYRQMRMNYYAVCATKARLYLWLGKKTDALKYAKIVMDAKDNTGNKMYRLGNSNDCARKDYTLSCEHIFNIYVKDLGTTSLGTARGYQKTKSQLTSQLYGSGSTDIRLNLMWDYVYDDYWWTYYNYFKKYLQSDNMPTLAKNVLPLIRLYEMYLIAMECSSLEEANNLYLEMCVARDIPAVEIDDINELKEILVKEYNKEFCGEGQTFYMFKRLGVETIPYAAEPGGIATYVIPLPVQETI